MSWVPLHAHSQYSILESTASVSGLAASAAAHKMEALALTDFGNLYAAVEFYKACKAVGVKAIFGCEMFLAPGSRHEKKRIHGIPPSYPFTLLAKNQKGYQNLCKLSSLGFLEGFYYTPRIDKELLAEYAEGLICLSGSVQGKIAALMIQGKEEELIAEIKWFQDLFGKDFYFELQRHRMKEEDVRSDGMEKEGWIYQTYLDVLKNQEKIIARSLEISQKMGIRCVATHDIRYLERGDWQAHEILINIQSGEPCEVWEKDSFGNLKNRVPNPKRQVAFTHDLYFKSPQEMRELFTDCPDALDATLDIAKECCVDLDFKTRFYPVYIPSSLQGKTFTKEERVVAAADFLKELCTTSIETRYTPDVLAKVQEKYPDREPLQVVHDRLSTELEIIISKGMCDYLLIVYDFIAWAKRQGIPMGPGRGSGAGSIILYLIGITDIEPLRFNLFFERFINPERLSYPDIDVDICMDRRAEVIDYTVRTYGKEKVAQIITFGTMKAKMAIKDVGRVLNIPLVKVNAIAKLVPEELNITLDKALEQDPELRQQYETDPEVHRLIDIAKKLEGSVRNTGIHAAGMIISADPIMDRIPICLAKDSEMAVTQFSMKPVESVGMLKIDFLGLKTLTTIQKTVDAVKKTQGIAVDWVRLPLDDKETFSLLNQGQTLGVFQLESGGMTDLCKQLHIDRFEEIIAVGALYRPGPMEMIPSFINRKHGRESLDIDHPLMKDILSETYGIMVYQEQVMQIASRLAGYSLGEGDVLRRAMGKKDKEEMSKQREKFRDGALKNDIDVATSMKVFDKIEKFASYGFNKSHAAAYGFLTYVTAYMKAHYPKEWMAALMTTDLDDISKVARIIRECQAMSIAILPPDVNESETEFMATSGGVRFALSAIKGVGEGVVEVIIGERNRAGAFTSLYDFLKRIDTKKVGKKVVEHLTEAGCFDFTGWSRKALLTSVDPMYTSASKDQKETARGVIDLFSLIETAQPEFSAPPAIEGEVPKQHLLKREKELLGFYLTGHPMDDFRDQIQGLSCIPFHELAELEHDALFRAAFIVESVQLRISSKSQRKFAILTISDGMEQFELPIWPELYEEKGHLLVDNQLLIAVLQIDKKEETLKLQCKWLDDLTQFDEKACADAFDRAKRQGKMNDKLAKQKKEEITSQLTLKIDAEVCRLSHILELKDLFRTFPGNCSIHIEFCVNDQKVSALDIDSTWGISLHPQLEERLRIFPSIKSIKK